MGRMEEPEAKPDPVFTAHLQIGNFFAAYGWPMLIGFIAFCFIWKNIREKYYELKESYEAGRIKKNEDDYSDIETQRQAKLEKLQKAYDVQAAIKKARQDEIDAA